MKVILCALLRTILIEIKKRKANFIGHVLCRNCLLWQVIEGKIKGGIEVTGRRGRRRRNLLDDLKEMGRYSHPKEEALVRTMWRAGFGRGLDLSWDRLLKRKANLIGHVLCRNCLLWQVIEGKIKGGIEVTGRRGRRRRNLLDDLKEMGIYSHLKEEALDRTMWRAGFGRGLDLSWDRLLNKWMN
jgi:hypothetical protein